MTNTMETTPRKRSLVPLILLVAVFALPPLVGWILFLNPQWLPDRHSNNGLLVQPPRTAEALRLFTPRGEPLDWNEFKDAWSLVVASREECGTPCKERLLQVSQIRRALGAERQRVQRLLILLPKAGQPVSLPSLTELEGVLVGVAVNDEDRSRVESLLDFTDWASGNKIFVIDPYRNLMMVHDADRLTSKEILKDMEKLLKASKNWVTGE
ncbi:MAG: hypothetical protein GY703_12480 [Gammaproteobacteria bacterium]|nr:hypothetical protein [Gammaproteobacteria bacterium]